jgi:hypothetical protein
VGACVDLNHPFEAVNVQPSGGPSASPTAITFTPTLSAYSIFSGSTGSFVFGSPSSPIYGGVSGSPCIDAGRGGSYGACSAGVLDTSTTTNPLNIAVAVPESSTWAMLILGFAGIGFMAYRRRNQIMPSAA